jgi:predicted nucleotidyltransferase
VPRLDDHPEVKALCLFGSAARRAEKDDSDVDILVVVTDSDDRVGLRRKARALRQSVDPSTQISLLTESRLRQNFECGSVFAAHLAREGEVLADRDGVVSQLLREHPKDAPVRESADRLRKQIEIYSDLSWCGGHYLFCLADLYAAGRSGAMLVLGRLGEFEFDRHRVFAQLAGAYPDLERAASTVAALRPFWERVNRAATVALPFSPTGSHLEVAEARDACLAILEKGM